MAWSTLRMNDANNLTALHSRGRSCKLRGFQDSSTVLSSKRSFCSYLHQEEELVSDDEGGAERASLRCLEKKRRLSAEQVKCLERNFEIESKLELQRKQKLANDLGLHPRQVAIWFQNRRARRKTKRLEQDYDSLKSRYDAVLLEREKLKAEVVRLTKEIEARDQKKRRDNPDEKKQTKNSQEECKYTKQLDRSSPGNENDVSTEKETSLNSDQTDISSFIHNDKTVLEINVQPELIEIESMLSSSVHINHYLFEQISRKMEENFFFDWLTSDFPFSLSDGVLSCTSHAI